MLFYGLYLVSLPLALVVVGSILLIISLAVTVYNARTGLSALNADKASGG